MGDVAEWTGVYERWLALHGLHDVRQQCILEQHGHGAGHPQVLGGDEAPILPLRHDDAPDTLAQVPEVARQRQDRHDL